MGSHKREPIKHTCPDINRYIKAIKQAIYTDGQLKGMEYNELSDVASRMASELESCIDYLEELRESNYQLREWGIEEAERVDELEGEK
jgi:FtsZ-binding cell division protein ZapB